MKAVAFGKPYGCDPAASWGSYVRKGRRPVYLYRKGQRCRWYTARGVQVGPEQRNVAPALAWAYANGYRSSTGWP